MPNELTITTPIVHIEGRRVFATSRDVATYFEKEHKHVLRDIDKLIEGGHVQFWTWVLKVA